MTVLHLVYEDEGDGPISPTLHATRHHALLEALYRLGDDMTEAEALPEAELEDRLDRLNNKITDFNACICSGTREEIEKFFEGTNLEIPDEVEPEIMPSASKIWIRSDMI
jgi:hypothetical protein